MSISLANEKQLNTVFLDLWRSREDVEAQARVLLFGKGIFSHVERHKFGDPCPFPSFLWPPVSKLLT